MQAHSHLPVLGHLLPGVELTILGRDPGRAAVLAEAAAATAGIGERPGLRRCLDATRDADVVVSAASFTSPERRQRLHAEAVAPEALVVPVDYATMVAADVAATAALFLVDDRGQYFHNRAAGQFDGYPEPSATIGEAMLAGTERPAAGRVVVTHLGVGLARRRVR